MNSFIHLIGDKAQGGPSASGADVGEFDPHIPD